MTALTSPAAPTAARTPPTRLVRVELLKLTSTRLPYGLLAASVGLTALFTVIEAVRAGTSGGPAALTGYPGQAAVTAGGVWSLILAAVLGTTISSGEFRHRTATLTYLAAPDRSRVLAAKTAAGAVAAAVFGLAGYLVTLGVTLGFVAAKGYPVAIGAGTLAGWGLGHVAGAALLGVIGVAVGSLIRSQLAAMIGIFAWMVIIESLLGGLFNAARPYLPYTAATALGGVPLGTSAFGPGRGAETIAALPFAAAAAMLLAIGVAGALLAARTTVRQDVTT
jgi:ABC-type transport system involved in multi-copper enzyme maturation permease subunit